MPGLLIDAYDYIVLFLVSTFGGTGGGGGGAFYIALFGEFFDGAYAHYAAALACAPMLACAVAVMTTNAFFRAHAPVAVAKDVFCIRFVRLCIARPGYS